MYLIKAVQIRNSPGTEVQPGRRKENTTTRNCVRALPTTGRRRKVKYGLTMADHVGTELPRSRGRKDGRNEFRRQGAKPNLKTPPQVRSKTTVSFRDGSKLSWKRGEGEKTGRRHLAYVSFAHGPEKSSLSRVLREKIVNSCNS
jgi:hypothetical protein